MLWKLAFSTNPCIAPLNPACFRLPRFVKIGKAASDNIGKSHMKALVFR
jgi:hypothetical protein